MAANYRALSMDVGRLEVSYTIGIAPDPTPIFPWAETGKPPIAGPSSKLLLWRQVLSGGYATVLAWAIRLARIALQQSQISINMDIDLCG